MNNVDIRPDLKSSEKPKRVFGFIVHELETCLRVNEKSFTVMSWNYYNFY